MAGLTVEAKYRSFDDAASFVRGLQLKPREAVVVLTRHGRTLFNEARKLQAWVPDVDRLSPLGEQNARLLREPLSRLPITWVASADIARALQTTRLALPGRPIEPFSCLRDIDYGRLGGLTFEGSGNQFETIHPELFRTWRDDRTNFAAPGGEDFMSLEKRVRDGFSGEVLPNCLGKVSLVTAHIGSIREILFCTVSEANADNIKLKIEGTSLTMIHFTEDAPPALLLFNNTDHLN